MGTNGPGPERGLLSRLLNLMRGSRALGSASDETDLRRALEARTTEDLSSILRERDEGEWRPEVFAIAASILEARGVSPSVAEPPVRAADSAEVPDVQPLVTVGQYFSPTEAHSHCMALEGAGLRAWVFDESAGSYLGVGIGCRLQVRAEDEAAARALLDIAVAPDSVSPVEPAEATHGHSRPESDDTEGTAAVEATVPETAEPIRQEAANEEDRRPRGMEAVELAGVVLLTAVYPALWGLLNEADTPPMTPGILAVGVAWSVGLMLLVWTLLERNRGPLSPIPLPASAVPWVREILAGGLLFLAMWVLVDPVVGRVLEVAGVPDSPTQWDSFYRKWGVTGIHVVESFFAVLAEEVVFRAYLISRLHLVLGLRRGWSVVVAAAMFAGTHGYPPRASLMSFAFGLVFGRAYLRSRRLPRLVVGHWLYNLAVMSYWLHHAR